MMHSFDTQIAEKYGVNVAIFLNNIHFWTLHNIANGKHYHDGRYWTYNSEKAFIQLFPYWTRQNLRTVKKDCLKHGLVVEGNYNCIGYDHTIWYALTDTGLSLFNLKVEIDIAQAQPEWLESTNQAQPEWLESTIRMVRSNHAIPDSKPDGKPNKKGPTKISLPPPIFEKVSDDDYQDNYYETKEAVKTEKDKELLIQEFLEINPHNLPEILIRTWVENKKQTNKPVNSGIWALMLADLYKYRESGLDPIECFETMVKQGWQSLNLKKELKHRADQSSKKSDPNSKGYLNQGYFN